MYLGSRQGRRGRQGGRVQERLGLYMGCNERNDDDGHSDILSETSTVCIVGNRCTGNKPGVDEARNLPNH
jgi:hypothetical protein